MVDTSKVVDSVVASAKSKTPAKKEAVANGLSGKRETVTFHKNPESGGSEHQVYISLNGVVYAYAYEAEVSVPVEVLNIIDQAVISKYGQGDKNGEMVETKIKRFPYTVKR